MTLLFLGILIAEAFALVQQARAANHMSIEVGKDVMERRKECEEAEAIIARQRARLEELLKGRM